MPYKSKSFKIGEYAVGGIIKVIREGETFRIESLDYNTKKLVESATFSARRLPENERAMWNYLNTLTSVYYTDKVMEWILVN